MNSDPRRWGVKGLQLQRPENVYFDGQVRPWEDAVFHVSTEAVTRGLNVFEGLRGYWQEGGGFAWRTLRRHYARMTRSASLLQIPVDFDYEGFGQAVFALTAAEVREGNDLYIRATLFVTEGHYGEGTVSDLVLTAYQQKTDPPTPVDVGTSTWRRAPDLSMPIRVKTSANYIIARMARIEGRSRGYEDMILLNQSGRVAEGIGACLLVVRDGLVLSPPTSEGAVESITLDLIESLAAREGIELVRRPIERSELWIADELALIGTLTEMTLIRSIDDRPVPGGDVLARIDRAYRDAVRGVRPHAAVEMVDFPRALIAPA
jgi:branched-chain amino acid aminotransferase